MRLVKCCFDGRFAIRDVVIAFLASNNIVADLAVRMIVGLNYNLIHRRTPETAYRFIEVAESTA